MDNKIYNFRNVVHVQTDNMGIFNKQWTAVGYENYPEKENHIKGYDYFSFDEAKELYHKGLTSDNLVEENGEFYLRCSHMSAITAFTIVNGIVPFANEKNNNLFEYAKKIGLVYDTPIPVNMHTGVKTLEIIEEDYVFRYTINRDNIRIRGCEEYLEKICIGAMKRLANSYSNYHHDGIVEKKYSFKCKSIHFDKDTLELKIVTTKRYSISSELTYALRKLDLELFVLYNKDEHNIVYVDAIMDMVRDMGQGHWINEYEESDNKSNKYWYDKSLPVHQDL